MSYKKVIRQNLDILTYSIGIEAKTASHRQGKRVTFLIHMNRKLFFFKTCSYLCIKLNFSVFHLHNYEYLHYNSQKNVRSRKDIRSYLIGLKHYTTGQVYFDTCN